MTEIGSDQGFRSRAQLDLDAVTLDALRARLPLVAEQTVNAITVDVPSYAGALAGRMGVTIENAVRVALGTFLQWVAHPEPAERNSTITPAQEGAYELGRGEARSGRTMDALLAAYRVGARVAWRDFAETAVSGGLPAASVADFAELVFAFIDELSAASVTGHADELATSGRVRERYLDRLAKNLLAGEPGDVLLASAERAGWEPPTTLTAALVPAAQARTIASNLGPRTLVVEELAGIDAADGIALLLVPDVEGGKRARLTAALDGTSAVLGPARDWTQAAASYRRAVRGRELRAGADIVDTDARLSELILGADPELLADLRRQVLAPLADLRPATAERLTDTLRAWLLHQGRRDDVAAELFVHAQTVRYRMGQIRELFGDRLDDPQTVLDLTVALGLEAGQEGKQASRNEHDVHA